MRSCQFSCALAAWLIFYVNCPIAVASNGSPEQADSLINAGQYDKAARLLSQIKSNITDKTDSVDRILLYLSYGKLYGALQAGKMDSSIYYLRLAESLATLQNNDSLLVDIYNQHGSNYLTMGNHSAALKYYLQIAELEKKLNDKSKLARTYYHLASVYHNEGYYLTALEYYEQSERLFNEILPPNHKTFGSIYNNKSNTFKVLGRFEQAMDHITKAIAIKEASYPAGNSILLNSYITQADIFLHNKKPDEAIPFLRKILEYEYLQNDQIADAYGFMGRALAQKSAYKVAIHYHKKSAELYYKTYGELQNWVPTTYQDISKIYREQQLYDSAITYVQLALTSNHHAFKSKAWDQNPKSEGAKNINYQIEMLGLKGSLLLEYYQKAGDEQSLESAYMAFQEVAEQINNERKFYRNKEAILYLGKEVVNIYEEAVTCAYEMFSKTSNKAFAHAAFKWSEQSKSFLLLKSMAESEAQSMYAMDETLKERENELHSEIKFYSEQQYKANVSMQDSIEYAKQLFDSNLRYDTLLSVIEASNPAYYQTKYNLQYASVRGIQAHLKGENEILISYYLAKDQLFSFVLSKRNFEINAQEIDSSFSKSILNFRNAVITRKVDQYKDINALLYKTLIQSLPLSPKVSKIILIPHDVLNYLPFEILFHPASSSNDLRNLNYLVKQYQISYDYSATLTYRRWFNKQVSSSTSNFLAFAPEFIPKQKISMIPEDEIIRSKVAPLLGAKQEARNAFSIWGGTLFIGEDATEQNFKKHGPNASILHLATHAIVDDSDPSSSRLLFTPSADSLEDGLLHAAELFEMSLSANLITLSACNTGFGQISKGEGVMSLGRAFAYAGVPSIVMSLWPAADQATATLMTFFYTNLKEGMNKDQALRQAKLQYLEQADNNAADPYLWGGFVLFGNRNPVEVQVANHHVLIASTILAIITLIYLFRFRLLRLVK